MSEFKVGGQTYSAPKMPLRAQFHVARRLLQALSPIAALAAAQGNSPDQAKGAAFIGALGAAIGSLKDEDADYILDACLDGVRRQEKGGWQLIKAPGGLMMYQDIELPQMIQIAAKVIQENLGGFFVALPAMVTEEGAKTTGSDS